MGDADRLAVELEELVAKVGHDAPSLVPVIRRLGQVIVSQQRELSATRRVVEREHGTLRVAS